MWIISDFKDYYDYVQSYYIDDLIYVRKKKIETREDNPRLLKFSNSFYDKKNFDSEKGHSYLYHIRTKFGRDYTKYCPIKLYFCNKMFNIIELDTKVGKFLFSSFDDFKNFIDISTISSFDIKTVKDFLSSGKCKYHQMMIENNCPIMAVYPELVVYNPRLLDFDFSKIMTPTQVYQEIFMFFNTELLPKEKPIPKIDDKTMAEAKGFNKYSFRKDKSKNV